METRKNTFNRQQMDNFFENLNELLYQTGKPNLVIISKYDNLGNWAIFACKRENNKIQCGGHIGICNYMGESFFSMLKFLEWASMLRKQNIELIIEAEWFLKC